MKIMFRPGCIVLKVHSTSIKMLIIRSMIWNGNRHDRWNLTSFRFSVRKAKWTITPKYTSKIIRPMIKKTCTMEIPEEMFVKLSLAVINSTLSTRFIKNTGITVKRTNTIWKIFFRTFAYFSSSMSSIPVKTLNALTNAYPSSPVPHGQHESSLKTNTRLKKSIILPNSSVMHMLYVYVSF